MFLLLLALAQGPAPQEAQAALKACEMTAGGWVCHYQIPAMTIVRPLEIDPPPEGSPQALPMVRSSPVVADPVDKAEAARRARLIANCADGSWLSLCLPADRREAKALRDAALVSAALRTQVTGLLSEEKCDEAVRAALAGGDMALAREARDFCKP